LILPSAIGRTFVLQKPGGEKAEDVQMQGNPEVTNLSHFAAEIFMTFER